MSRELEAAVAFAKAGGEILKKYFGNLTDVQTKSHAADLVTEADKESEKKIISMIKKEFPSHGILAEESGLVSDKEYMWIIDPLDGTTNYTHQYPLFAVSIGLVHKGKPLCGVVFNPIFNELFTAEKGSGAYLNNRQIKVSRIASLDKALLATGFANNRDKNNYPEFCHFTTLTHGVRRAGSAAIDLAYVACGRLDGFWEAELKPWDIAAGALLIEEAGGAVSLYDGSPLDLYADNILVSNGHIHNQLIEEISKF